MDEPANPRTRYGMAVGLVVISAGVGLILIGRFTSTTIALAGASAFGIGLVVGNLSAILDAVLLRRHGVGWAVSTTVILVLLTGPVWVAYALWRRDAWRGVERSFAERAGRTVEAGRRS